MTGASAAPLRRTLAIIGRVRGRLALAVLLGAASMLCGIGLLATSAWLLSRASEHPSIVYLSLAIVAVRFFAIARGLFRYAERLVGHDTTFRFLGDLRVRVYERLERLAPTGLGAFRRGDLLARLVGDVDALQDLTLRVIIPFAIATIVGLATVALVAVVLPAAAFVLAGTLLLAATAVPMLTGRCARTTEATRAVLRGELTAAVVDLADGARDLWANGATESQLTRIAAADETLTRVSRASARTAGVGAGLTTLLTGVAVVGAVIVGVAAVHAGRLDGVLLATVVLIPLAVFDAFAGLPAATQSLEGVRRSAARVFTVLDAPPAVVDASEDAAALPAAPITLRVRGLRVAYRVEGAHVLHGVDLDLAPGARVALVGPSGAGKSTMANALVRFVPYAGSIDLNGVELDRLAGDDVRRVVGLLPQDVHLFQTTIRENLRVGRRDATDADLFAALERVDLAAAVAVLPCGLDTRIGANGSGLSGGERQRLGVARVLLARFPVLIVDEPAEHLDDDAADALTADILSATRSQTILLITHRLAGLDAMDEIVVLDRGCVLERGTHDQLLVAGGWYARTYERQQRSSLRVLEGGSRR